MSRHIVCFNVSEKGHLHPTLGLVKELVNRGNKVTYVVFPWTEEAFLYNRSAIELQGATCVNLYSVTSWRWNGSPGPQSNLPCAAETADEVLSWIPTLSPPPSAILYDPFCPLGKIVSQRLSLPLIASLSFTPFSGPTKARWNSQSEIEAVKDRHGVDLTYKSWLHPTLPFSSQNSTLNIMYSVRPLLENLLPVDILDKIYFAGIIVADRGEKKEENPVIEEIKAAKNRGSKILYISLGTVVVNDEKPILKAFLQRFFNLVLSVVQERPDIEAFITFIGAAASWLEGKDLPKNFHPCSFVPQLEVLPLADMFFTHAGANSLNESLYFGVPIIALPFSGDQIGNAKAVVSCGAGFQFQYDDGVVPGPHTDPERVSLTHESFLEAVRVTLDPVTKENVRKISELYRSCSPVKTVDLILEKLDAY